jgi:hypothetical protein
VFQTQVLGVNPLVMVSFFMLHRLSGLFGKRGDGKKEMGFWAGTQRIAGVS